MKRTATKVDTIKGHRPINSMKGQRKLKHSPIMYIILYYRLARRREYDRSRRAAKTTEQRQEEAVRCHHRNNRGSNTERQDRLSTRREDDRLRRQSETEDEATTSETSIMRMRIPIRAIPYRTSKIKLQLYHVHIHHQTVLHKLFHCSGSPQHALASV